MALNSIEKTVKDLPVAASKRPVASLLPAFEPFSSSPSLPRPLKRNRDALNEDVTYPTPVPTSSTAILSSSPPRISTGRPPLQRLHSIVSERAPLSDVPTIELNPDGKPILMGRSSASCHYQLSSNRLISRVHVQATYKPASSVGEKDRVEIVCTGWNPIKVHCLGQVYELKKAQRFSSDAKDVDIMVDALDARVLLKWPPIPRLGPVSSDEEEGSPTKRSRTLRRHSTPPSPSPLQTRHRLVSPISPSPAVRAALLQSSPSHAFNFPQDVPVVVYEDEPSPGKNVEEDPAAVSQSTQTPSQHSQANPVESQESALSSSQDFSDHDEENDPIIHSFGPFGANLSQRMASFTAGDSPRLGTPPRSFRAEPLQPAISPPQKSSFSNDFDVAGHVINQLAFSRLSSTPLSTILSHLPDEAGIMSNHDLASLISAIDCVGKVTREGKDAAGKPLETEYYYIPEQDQDEKRKEAVVNDLQKPGLRACRKQHKVRDTLS